MLLIGVDYNPYLLNNHHYGFLTDLNLLKSLIIYKLSESHVIKLIMATLTRRLTSKSTYSVAQKSFEMRHSLDFNKVVFTFINY